MPARAGVCGACVVYNPLDCEISPPMGVPYKQRIPRDSKMKTSDTRRDFLRQPVDQDLRQANSSSNTTCRMTCSLANSLDGHTIQQSSYYRLKKIIL